MKAVDEGADGKKHGDGNERSPAADFSELVEGESDGRGVIFESSPGLGSEEHDEGPERHESAPEKKA